MFKRVAGTKDILPEETPAWQAIEEASRNIFSLYNYKEIRPPIIEEAVLFNRSLGEFAEIVQKQMFLIKAAHDVYALRPEGTASIVRAYLENNLYKNAGLTKVYYIGPMFRLERPQKGRLRQFHHIGCEAIGAQDAYLDVEVISLADSLLKACCIGGYKIKINSLGCLKDKKRLTEILRKKLEGKLAELCPDCHNRFKYNVLRVLDCKNESCIEAINRLDIENEYLCPECKTHFTEIKSGLGSLKIDYEVNPHLVRGLDYYTRTVFEITHSDLGAQNALGAGGRYDNLVQDLGGPSTGAMGLAFGIERLLLVAQRTAHSAQQNLVFLIALGEEAKKEAVKLLDLLRRNEIPSDTDYEYKSLKGAMRRASDLSAKFVLIIGEDELKKGVVALKDMASGEQKEVKVKDLISEVMSKVKIK